MRKYVVEVVHNGVQAESRAQSVSINLHHEERRTVDATTGRYQDHLPILIVQVVLRRERFDL